MDNQLGGVIYHMVFALTPPPPPPPPPTPRTKWPPSRRRCFQMRLSAWEFSILIEISLKFVQRGSIDNKPILVQIMAWRWIGDKPLSEPMLTQFTDAYMRYMGRYILFHNIIILFCKNLCLSCIGITYFKNGSDVDWQLALDTCRCTWVINDLARHGFIRLTGNKRGD